MRHILYAAAALAAISCAGPAASPAFAQAAPGVGGMQGPQVQPRARTPDIAPPALPGAGETPGLGTAPKPPRVVSGDPTTALFDAINRDDYNAAQDALSRGADLTAQDALGETPLDLSIALNHNNITFMILSARNEGGAAAPVQAQAQAPAAKARAVPAKAEAAPVQAAPVRAARPADAAGTPDPAAGFLGFGQAK
jgi:hypothetical protein